MSPEEINAFNNKLKADAHFRKLYEDINAIKSSARYSTLNSKLSMLKHLDEEIDIKNRITESNLWKKIIAGVLIVLGLLLFGKFLENRIFAEKNYRKETIAANFKHLNSKVLQRSSKIQNNDLLSEAYEAYEIKDYKNASKKLKNLYELESDTLSLFFAGISFLAINEVNEAISCFKICRKSETINNDHLEYYEDLLREIQKEH